MSAASNSNANDVPGLEFTPRKEGDVIDNALIAELSRRLRFASSPSGGSGSVNVGIGSTSVSSESGNQIQGKPDGIFVSLGAGLGVFEGSGLFLNANNQIQLRGQRNFIQSHNVTADGSFTFTLPEQMDTYSVALTAFGDPSAARFWVSNRTSTALTVNYLGVTVPFIIEAAATEVPA